MNKKLTGLLLLFCLFITGCGQENFEIAKKEHLKVALIGTTEKRMLKAFKFFNPDIEIEEKVYSANVTEAELKEISKQSDVIISPPIIHRQLAIAGELYPLSTQIKKEIDWKEFEPFVKPLLENLGDGTIYGLTSRINSLALICQGDLFEKAGVKIPEERMTWDQFFNMSKKLTNTLKQPAFAFSLDYLGDDYAQMIELYANSSQFTVLDKTKRNFQLTHAGWQESWKKINDLIESKALIFPGNGQSTEEYGMLKIPMVFGTYEFIEHSRDIEKHKWKVIPLPKSPTAPDKHAGIFLSNLYAISTNNSNQEAAWKLLKFSVSPGYTKSVHFDSSKWTVNKKANQQIPYHEAFVHGESLGVTDWMRLMDYDIKLDYALTLESRVKKAMTPYFKDYHDAKITLEEALSKWNADAQEMIGGKS